MVKEEADYGESAKEGRLARYKTPEGRPLLDIFNQKRPTVNEQLLKTTE